MIIIYILAGIGVVTILFGLYAIIRLIMLAEEQENDKNIYGSGITRLENVNDER